MDDAFAPQLDRRRAASRKESLAPGLGQHDLHALVAQVVIDGPRGVAAAADAGHQVVGIVAALLFLQLHADLLADDRLQARHHVGIRVRPHRRTDDVERVGRMAAPVADGLVGGVLQGHVARGHGYDPRAQHLHLPDVGLLALDIGLPHVDHARHVHQRADRRRGHTVLPGPRLGDDARLAHPPGDQDLPDGVVDLVGAGVVEVLAFEVDAAAVALAQPACEIERRRPARIVAQQGAVLLAERLAFEHPQVVPPQVFDAFVQDFGDVCAPEASVITFLIDLIVHIHQFFWNYRTRKKGLS